MKRLANIGVLIASVVSGVTASVDGTADQKRIPRIQAETVRSTHGGLTGAQRNTEFSLAGSQELQQLFFMDFTYLLPQSLQPAPKKQDLALRDKIARYEKQQRQKTMGNVKFGGRQHRLGINDQSKMFNIENQLYFGSLYIGSEQQKMQVIFDSGSDWLLMEGKDCVDDPERGCKENGYISQDSTYFNERSSVEENRIFGTFMHLTGRQVSDHVCLLRFELCVKPFSWFYITDQYGLPSTLVDGIFGLTQGGSILGGYEPPNDFTTKPSLLYYLFLNEHITEVSFSTHFSQQLQSSYIDFGTPRIDGMSSPNDVVYFNTTEGYFYTLEPTAVRFGNPEISGETEFSIPVVTAILSTGLSYNLVPSSIQKRFFELLLEGVTYEESNGVFYTSCNTRPANVWIMVEGYWIQFSGQDMIIDTKIENKDEQVCIINFLPNVDDFWVFGNRVFVDYYVIHSPDKGTIGFAPTELRKKPVLEQGSIPEEALNAEFSIITLILKLLMTIIVCVGTVTLTITIFGKTSSFKGFGFLNKTYTTTFF